MPTYDYMCQECQHQLEAFQKITEQPLVKCPKCQKDSLQRKPGGGIGLAFKGSGFYVNDYARSPSKTESDKPASSCQKGNCGCH